MYLKKLEEKGLMDEFNFILSSFIRSNVEEVKSNITSAIDKYGYHSREFVRLVAEYNKNYVFRPGFDQAMSVLFLKVEASPASQPSASQPKPPESQPIQQSPIVQEEPTLEAESPTPEPTPIEEEHPDTEPVESAPVEEAIPKSKNQPKRHRRFSVEALAYLALMTGERTIEDIIKMTDWPIAYVLHWLKYLIVGKRAVYKDGKYTIPVPYMVGMKPDTSELEDRFSYLGLLKDGLSMDDISNLKLTKFERLGIRPRSKKDGTPLADLFLSLLNNGEVWTTDQLLEELKKRDYSFGNKSPRRTVNGTLIGMARCHLIEFLGDGKWKIRQKTS